jgi:hypothetical protein
MTDVTLEIGYGKHPNFQLRVRGTPIDQQVAPLMLDPTLLDELRTGEALPATVTLIGTSVTNWLMVNGLSQHLAAEAANSGGVRVVLEPVSGLFDEKLSDVPFELVDFNAHPLVLGKRIRSLVHAVSRGGQPPAVAQSTDWPLRVLIVRSNPADLGGARVPPADPIRQAILTSAQNAFGAGNVKVTMLSSEPGADGAPTWQDVATTLTQQHDIFVYLGHGDVVEAMVGNAASGALYLERPDGKADMIEAKRFTGALGDHPIPVVLLAGCLTAAPPGTTAEEKEREKLLVPRWMRGSQIVARSLVDSQAGVAVAVGMRYRIETLDATKFLGAFFDSLLTGTPGDVESAVRAGRLALFLQNPMPPAWSAPVIFRSEGDEPMFPYLAKKPVTVGEDDLRDEQVRAASWSALADHPVQGRDPKLFKLVYDPLDEAEARIRKRATDGKHPIVGVTRADVSRGATATLGVELAGALEVRSLTGIVRFGAANGNAMQPVPAPALTAAGFTALFAAAKHGELKFRLEAEAAPGANVKARPLPQGPLFDFQVAAGSVAPAVHPVTIAELERDPAGPVRPIGNAVIVSV